MKAHNLKLKTTRQRKRSLKALTISIRRRKKYTKRERSEPVSVWSGRAYRAGQIHAQNIPKQSTQHWKQDMRHGWNYWLSLRKLTHIPWKMYEVLCRQYIRGFQQIKAVQTNDWLLPTMKTTAAVVTAKNEEKELPNVLKQLERLNLDEVIVVVNGSTDGSFEAARAMKNAIIIHYPHPLGHDIGRAIGAMASSSDIVLFLDGDLPIAAEQLAPFVGEIERGKDVALNDISKHIGLFSQRDAVTIMKEFLNRILGRSELGSVSLTAIPHAMSRKAMETIGYSLLAVPPKAQAKAAQLGLSIGLPISVDVISKNKIREKMNVGVKNPVADMIVGDHIEALAWLMKQDGPRLTYHDLFRNREMVKEEGG